MKIAFTICAILTLVMRDTIPGQVILGWDTANQDRFSRTADVSGRWIIIGAPNHTGNHGTSSQGSAYVLKDVQGTWTENVELLRANPQQDDGFGFSVAIKDASAIVGIPGAGTGMVQIYKRVTGPPTGATYVPDGPEIGPDLTNPAHNSSQFGFSVDIDGDYAVVGDPTATINYPPLTVTGRVTVFRRSGSPATWQVFQTIENPYPTVGGTQTNFGASVSISAGMVAIGAPTETRTVFQEGVVYFRGASIVYDFGEIISPAPVYDGGFGSDIDFVQAAGDARLVVGEPGGSSYGGFFIGGAHYFHNPNITIQNSWPSFPPVTLAHPTLPPPAVLQGFGTSVSLKGLTIVVGAPYEGNQQGSNAGGAYMYKEQSVGIWTLTDLLYAFDFGSPAQLFGSSTAIDESETLVLVGSNGSNVSRAYTFNY